jgi:hypothetical protein
MNTRLINTARIEAQSGCFKKKEMINLLKGVKYYTHPMFIPKLMKFGIIEKAGRGFYKFSDKPAYHGVVENVLKEIKEYASEKNRKYKQKSESPNKEQEAINYLLSLGNYEIYRITTRTVVDKELLNKSNQE